MVGAKTAEAGQFERTSLNNRCTCCNFQGSPRIPYRALIRPELELTFWDVAISQFRVCTWDLFSPIQISTCPIDRTPLSLAHLSQREGSFSSIRASEQGWQRRWIEMNGRFVPHLDGRGRSVGGDCGAMPSSIANQPSFVASGLGRRTDDDVNSVHTSVHREQRVRRSFAQISKNAYFARAR